MEGGWYNSCKSSQKMNIKENTHIPYVVAGNWFSNVLEWDYRYIRQTKMWCLMPHELTIHSAESTKYWIWHALTLTCSRQYTHSTLTFNVFTIPDNSHSWCWCSRLVGLFFVLDSISESIFRLPFDRRLSGNMGSRNVDKKYISTERTHFRRIRHIRLFVAFNFPGNFFHVCISSSIWYYNILLMHLPDIFDIWFGSAISFMKTFILMSIGSIGGHTFNHHGMYWQPFYQFA